MVLKNAFTAWLNALNVEERQEVLEIVRPTVTAAHQTTGIIDEIEENEDGSNLNRYLRLQALAIHIFIFNAHA